MDTDLIISLTCFAVTAQIGSYLWPRLASPEMRAARLAARKRPPKMTPTVSVPTVTPAVQPVPPTPPAPVPGVPQKMTPAEFQAAMSLAGGNPNKITSKILDKVLTQ